MKVTFNKRADSEYKQWASKDENIFDRINAIIEDIERNPRSGLGKPELLKHNLSGLWSRRIDERHRMIYRIIDKETVEIVSCYSHYGDNKKHLKRKKL